MNDGFAFVSFVILADEQLMSVVGVDKTTADGFGAARERFLPLQCVRGSSGLVYSCSAAVSGCLWRGSQCALWSPGRWAVSLAFGGAVWSLECMR